MASSTTRGVVYPTAGDMIAPMETVFANMANSIETALDDLKGEFEEIVARTGGSGDVIEDHSIPSDTDYHLLPLAGVTVQNVTYGTDRFTILEGGVYAVTGFVNFNPDNTGIRGLGVGINNSVGLQNYRTVQGATQGAPTTLNVSALVTLTQGDIVDLRAFQTSGDPLVISNGRFDLVRVSV